MLRRRRKHSASLHSNFFEFDFGNIRVVFGGFASSRAENVDRCGSQKTFQNKKKRYKNICNARGILM